MLGISKVLASIVIWILFLMGIQGIIWTFIAGWKEEPFEIIGFFSLWVVTLLFSVVAMKLRKSLE